MILVQVHDAIPFLINNVQLPFDLSSTQALWFYHFLVPLELHLWCRQTAIMAPLCWVEDHLEDFWKQGVFRREALDFGLLLLRYLKDTEAGTGKLIIQHC